MHDEAESGSDSWHKRRKATQAKLTGGDPLQVAEIVRDGESRRQRTNAHGERKMLSLAGKNQYVKARQLLAGEIAIARGLDLIEADAWIDIQLAAGTS